MAVDEKSGCYIWYCRHSTARDAQSPSVLNITDLHSGLMLELNADKLTSTQCILSILSHGIRLIQNHQLEP